MAVWESLKAFLSGVPQTWVWAAGVAVVAFVATIVATFALRVASRTRRERRSQKGQLSYVQGLNHMLNGQTSQAIAALTRAVKLDGDNVDAYLRLGSLFRVGGQPGRAVRIHKSLLMRPNLPEQLVINAVYELALDYRDAGDLEKAADVLQKVVTLDSNHVVAYRELRSIYEKAGRWENAVNTEKRLLRLARSKDQRSLSPLHLAWGRDLLDKDQTEGALQSFRQAIKLDPQNALAHLALGDALFDSGQTRAAITAWEQLMKYSPAHFPYALERLERAYFAAGHYDDLRKVYIQYLDSYPDNPTVRLALAEFYLRRGRLDEAGKELERIEEDSLGSVRANLHLLRIDREGEQDRWKGHLETAMEKLSALSHTFRCRACGKPQREYFWRCPECDELDSAARAFPPSG